MKILDFHRSFFFFEIDFDLKPPKTVSDFRQNRHNRARIRIDCRCQITNPDGKATEYYLGESCKSERVGCSKKEHLFIQPNADFRPAYSQENMIIFKSWDKNDKGVMLIPASLGPQSERQVIDVNEAFYRHRLSRTLVTARPLKTIKQILAAGDAGHPIIARTVFRQAGFKVLLEYPVLTLNLSEKHQFYQTDTGPVLFPELTRKTRRVAETFRLAFCAFNRPNWVEFIVQKPTPLARGVSVNHYSQSIQVDSVNSLFATE